MEQRDVELLRDLMRYEGDRTSPPDGFPAFPDIPGGRYKDALFHAVEQRHLFRKAWLFAGHMDEIPETGSYKLWDMAEEPLLVVRGGDGIPRAFYNTCRHRGAPIVTQPSGRAEHGLVCGYHGWVYGHDGSLRSVRDKRDFTGLEFSRRGLRPVRTETYGKMIFVNFDPDAVPLLDYLGPVAREWEEFQFDKVRLVDRFVWDLDCNWKVGVESNLEVYHVKSIHPETVSPWLDYRRNVNTFYRAGHSRMVAPNFAKPAGADFVPSTHDDRPDMETVGEIARTGTQSYSVIPNWVSPLYAHGFPVLMYWPAGPNRTRFEVWFFGADWGDGPCPEGWSRHIEHLKHVLGEDTQFAPWIQKGLESSGFEGATVSYQEARIYYLHQAIDRFIGSENIPEALRVPPVISDDWLHPNDIARKLPDHRRSAAE